MVNVIVNADDFGCNQIINKSIKQLMLRGLVSSATVMANGQDLDEAVSFAKEHKEFSFGAHLCLSEFASITNDIIMQKYGLIDNQGYFVERAVFYQKTFPKEFLSSIKKELSAQLEVLLSKNLSVSHIDSHHHVHTIYPLKDIFVEVAEEYGIKRIRRATEFDTIRTKLHVLQYIQRRRLNSYYETNMQTTDLFMPYLQIYKKSNKLSNNIRNIELMCHPGHISDSYYVSEIDKMVSNPIHKEMGWSLISYNEL